MKKINTLIALLTISSSLHCTEEEPVKKALNLLIDTHQLTVTMISLLQALVESSHMCDKEKQEVSEKFEQVKHKANTSVDSLTDRLRDLCEK